MRVELVTDAGWDAALAEWSALLAADPSATPFASVPWARAWMRHYAPEARPWLLLVRDGSRCAGIAALALRRMRGLRVLRGLGQEPGDYWDVVAAPADRSAVRDAVVAELARRDREWDLCELRCLPPGSPTGEAFRTVGLPTLVRPSVVCPAIELPPTFDEYLAGLPSRRRTSIRRHLRRLEEGEVELHEVRDPARLAVALGDWQRLRARQWDERGRAINPEHRTDRFRAFLLEATIEMVPHGSALVWEYRIDGATAGVYVNFADPRCFYVGLGGFDPAHAGLGLGKITTIVGIRQSIEQGRARYDFTRGAEAYKSFFGATDRHGPSVIVGTARARSRLALAAAGVVSARRERAAERAQAG